eukprot:1099818-Pelagomonas_calceolata.AAC.1
MEVRCDSASSFNPLRDLIDVIKVNGVKQQRKGTALFNAIGGPNICLLIPINHKIVVIVIHIFENSEVADTGVDGDTACHKGWSCRPVGNQ